MRGRKGRDGGEGLRRGRGRTKESSPQGWTSGCPSDRRGQVGNQSRAPRTADALAPRQTFAGQPSREAKSHRLSPSAAPVRSFPSSYLPIYLSTTLPRYLCRCSCTVHGLVHGQSTDCYSTEDLVHFDNACEAVSRAGRRNAWGRCSHPLSARLGT